MSPDSLDPDRLPENFAQARDLLISTSWSLLTKQQKTRVHNLFNRHYHRTLYPSELLYLAVNDREERS